MEPNKSDSLNLSPKSFFSLHVLGRFAPLRRGLKESKKKRSIGHYVVIYNFIIITAQYLVSLEGIPQLKTLMNYSRPPANLERLSNFRCFMHKTPAVQAEETTE